MSESVWERRRAACQDYAPKHREHGQLGLTQHFAATPISQEPKWARDSRIAKARDAQAPQAKRRAAAAPRSGAGAPLKQASNYRRRTKDSLRGCSQFSDLLIWDLVKMAKRFEPELLNSIRLKDEFNTDDLFDIL